MVILYVICVSYVSTFRFLKQQNVDDSITNHDDSKVYVAPMSIRTRSGARFLNGTLGLVIDPTFLTKLHYQKVNVNVPQREKSCKVDNAIDHVAFEVFKKIRNGVMNSREIIEHTAADGIRTRTPRILCMAYTRHSGAHSRIEAIANTWEKECDGFFAASNATGLSIGAINLTHKGPEAYGNMWQKVRSMWA